MNARSLIDGSASRGMMVVSESESESECLEAFTRIQPVSPPDFALVHKVFIVDSHTAPNLKPVKAEATARRQQTAHMTFD